MLQNATPLRKSAPGPPNISDEHVSCTAPATENVIADPLQMSHACSRFSHLWPCAQSPAPATQNDIWTSKSAPFPSVFFLHFWLRHVIRATTVRTFSTCQLPKVVREWFSLCILTWTCASRHNGVHLFDMSPSKSDPTLGSFVHFDLEMCFVPQRRTLFRHRNFQKWSDTEVFCTFWLRDVLRATTVCNFSSLCPDGSAPAALPSPLFDPLWSHKSSEKDSVSFRDFPTFRAPGSSFFWLFLLWSSFFFSSLLWLFPTLLFICPYCRKLDF